MKKLLSVAVALCLAAAMLAGCGKPTATSGSQASPGNEQTAAPKKKVTLTISYKSGDATVKPLMNGFFDEFGKMYDGQYEIVPLETGSQTHEELLKVKLATGDFPDVWEVVELNNYIQAGVAGELPKEVGDMMKYLPLVDGKSYYAPLMTTALGVFYNKDIFAQQNIEVPQTYADFLAACEKIKATGVTPMAFGGKDPWHTYFLTACLLQDNVISKNPQFNIDLNSGKAKWTDPDVIAALTKYQDLFNAGYIDKKGALSTADSEMPTLMGNGKTAMLVEGPWMIKPISDANPSLNFGFFPLPADSASDTLIPAQGLGDGLGLSKMCVDDPDKRAAGIAFLQFFFGKETYSKYLTTTSGFSTVKEEIQVDRLPAALDMQNALNTVKSANYYAGGIGAEELPAGWWEYSWKVCQDLAVGTVTPEQAGQNLQEYYDKMLAASKG
jgi:raffinose/stachyose/melibiose transport system substrate-binding protein